MPKLSTRSTQAYYKRLTCFIRGWRGVTLQRHLNEGAAGQATYHQVTMPEVKRASTRWRPSDGKGKVVGLYICTMRRYAPLQYQQVLLRVPTAALYCISSPTTASTFALACCDDFCQRRAKLYLTYCKRAFSKPQSGKSAQQARANAYFFRRSVACIAIPRQDPLRLLIAFGAHFIRYLSRGARSVHLLKKGTTVSCLVGKGK